MGLETNILSSNTTVRKHMNNWTLIERSCWPHPYVMDGFDDNKHKCNSPYIFAWVCCLNKSRKLFGIFLLAWLTSVSEQYLEQFLGMIKTSYEISSSNSFSEQLIGKDPWRFQNFRTALRIVLWSIKNLERQVNSSTSCSAG